LNVADFGRENRINRFGTEGSFVQIESPPINEIKQLWLPDGSLFLYCHMIDKFDTRMRSSAIPASAEIALDAFVPRSYTAVVITVTMVGLQNARRQGTEAL
jgi:hypothetical protein